MAKFKSPRYPKLSVNAGGVPVKFNAHFYETKDAKIIAALKKNPNVMLVEGDKPKPAPKPKPEPENPAEEITEPN